jgi:putative heme-binding domain-containing protein
MDKTPVSEVKKYGPTKKLAKAEMKIYDQGFEIFNRDSHCVTCHQPNGQGLAPQYPALVDKEWLSGNDDRLIKFVLKGLFGPLEANGKHYDPTKGTPPMTGFEQMLKDNEIAAVLTYVRQSFGNDYPPITAKQVAKVRKEAESQSSYYQVEDLMKQHPIAGWEKWATVAATAGPEGDVAAFKSSLTGGKAEEGRKLFFDGEKVKCAACHKINGKGADVGPDLSKVASQKDKDRAYFLESLILPSKVIVKGFETEMLKLNDGRMVMGIVKKEDAKSLSIMPADGKMVEVAKDQVKLRKKLEISSMPPMGEVLSKSEIANVIEFLSTLK